MDLKGTGLTGFTQDRAGDSQVFSGTLNGGGTNGNGTINLAVGEPYGKRGEAVLDGNDTSNGNGKIYRHGRLGLFAAVNGATISNVTIAGSMKFDNGSAIDAGSLAGGIVGNLSLSSVTCKTNIACDDTFANDVNIGGIAGSVSAAATVAFKGNSKAQTTITAAGSLNGNSRIGGAIGYVSDCASTFNVTGLEVAGSIETGDCAGGKIAQVGGLIGCIAQSTYNAGTIANSADKHVNISGLSFNSFKMNVGRNGDALNGAGGLLGYSWGNAIVTIGDAAANTSGSTYALKTTNNTTVAASDSTEVGGLVYAASGHWIINNYAIDLSGTTINAGAAQTLGVLVCRGCKVDNKTTYGVENYIGLYLEDKACWETAYRVPSGEGAIVAPGVTSFDEWVGSGVNQAKAANSWTPAATRSFRCTHGMTSWTWTAMPQMATATRTARLSAKVTKRTAIPATSTTSTEPMIGVKAALAAAKSIRRTSCSYGLLSAMLPPVFVRQSFPMVRQGLMVP